MKIKFEKYNLNWPDNFQKLKSDLEESLYFLKPIIEHIGSTSVEGLSAKPIIDILIGVNNIEDLEQAISPLIEKGCVYYEKYNVVMPYRRFFVKHKLNFQNPSKPKTIKTNDEIWESTDEHQHRLAHIHIVQHNSENWIRHIAFRDYLRANELARKQYQQFKEELSGKEWRDGNQYNEAKNDYIKTQEQKAINWYQPL